MAGPGRTLPSYFPDLIGNLLILSSKSANILLVLDLEGFSESFCRFELLYIIDIGRNFLSSFWMLRLDFGSKSGEFERSTGIYFD